MRHLIFIYLIFLSVTSFSQLTHSLSLGPELAIPGKNMSGANIGFGGSLQYQLKFSEKIGIQLHGGYNQFTGKSSSSGKIDFLSARVGLVGYLYEDVIFVSADAGVSRFHANTTGTKKNGFSLGIGGGYRFLIGPTQFAQLSVSYIPNSFRYSQSGQSYTNKYDWFGIRAAVGLNFGKRRSTEEREE